MPLSIIKSLTKRDNVNASVLAKKYIDFQLETRDKEIFNTLITDTFLISKDTWVGHNSEKIGNGIEGSCVVKSGDVLKKDDLENFSAMSLVTWGEDKFIRIWRMKKKIYLMGF